MSEELEQAIEVTEPTTAEQPSALGSAPTEPPVETDAPDYGALPASADDYSVELEGFDFAEFKADDKNQAFLEKAFATGITNEGMELILEEYNSRAAELIQANTLLDADECVSAMAEVWGAETNRNLDVARSCARVAIQQGVLTEAEVAAASFGNNPAVLKMCAWIGAQLKEDTPPVNTQSTGAEDIRSLMSSEAYNDSKHPDHNRVYQKVSKYYELQNS